MLPRLLCLCGRLLGLKLSDERLFFPGHDIDALLRPLTNTAVRHHIPNIGLTYVAVVRSHTVGNEERVILADPVVLEVVRTRPYPDLHFALQHKEDDFQIVSYVERSCLTEWQIKYQKPKRVALNSRADKRAMPTRSSEGNGRFPPVEIPLVPRNK